MKTRRSKSSSRPLIIGIAAGAALVLATVAALELRSPGGARHETAMQRAPEEHPAAAASGGPVLHFSTTSVDFGVVPLGKEVGYAFSYANIGAETLRIEDVNVRAVRGC